MLVHNMARFVDVFIINSAGALAGITRSSATAEILCVRGRHSTGMGTGTVPGRNNVVSVRSRNNFCSGAGPRKGIFAGYLAYNITILQTTD